MLFRTCLYLISGCRGNIVPMLGKRSFINHVFAAMYLAAGVLPVYAAEAPLYDLGRPAARVAPQHALDSRVDFRLDANKLSRLILGETLEVSLPDQRILRASVSRLHELIGGTTKRHTVLALEGGRGSIELLYSGLGVSKVRISDIQSTIRVYEAVLDVSGIGELVEQDANLYYCIDMPLATVVSNTKTQASLALAASTPDLAQLQSLQSKPTANKVLYLNYWGGILSGTQWNDEYNSGQDINYSAFSSDGDAGSFSSTDLDLMWMGWREVVEDYAPFDINVTTDPSIYEAALSEDRSLIIATTSYAWFGLQVGGVANPGTFGNDYSGVGWAWNNGLDSFGQTMAHEAGHQMGLKHDGKANPYIEYYEGHGANDEWGPIMGASYGKTYVQWSNGEYDDANNQEDDLNTIRTTLGADSDVIGDTQGTSYQLPSSAYIEGVIEPRGLLVGMDTDVYRFDLSTTQNVEIQIGPVLGDDTARNGSNFSMYARLTDGLVDFAESTQNAPFYPQNNILSYSGSLDSGTYYLVITALSPNLNPDTGFGEYGNGGIYSISLASEIDEPDLISSLSVEDSDVYVGQLVQFSAQVQNIGTSIAQASVVRFYQSDDQTISGADTQIMMRNTLALDSLESDFITEQLVVTDTPGTIYYGSCTDVVAGENSVLNNCSAAIEFTVSDPGLDLDIGEAVEQPSLSWLRGGDGSFFRQTDVSMNEGDAARSGVIADDEISYIRIELNGPGWLRFHWKVSSEDDFDYFRFMSDGLEVDAISGETDWTPVTFELGSGMHSLQWRYDKDPFFAEGDDAGWLDNVKFAAQKFEITSFDGAQPEQDTGMLVDYSFTVNSNGMAGAPASINYTVSGTGLNPVDADDFGGIFPADTIEFEVGETEKLITISVSGDTSLEMDETFSFTLGNPQGGVLGDIISVQSGVLDDDDDDADGVEDVIDNCPDNANPGQANADGDAWGDVCDDDDDNDGVDDVDDNCPLDANPGQEDICTLCFPIKSSSDSLAIICL